MASERIERDFEAAAEKAWKIEERTERNAIAEMGLRYRSGIGFQSTARKIVAGLVSAEFELTGASGFTFEPKAYEVDRTRIEVIDIFVSKWTTAVALRIFHDDPECVIRAKLVNKRQRWRSPIVLLDNIQKREYEPGATDIPEEIHSNSPALGIVVFEPLSTITTSIAVKITEIRFTAHPFAPELIFGLKSNRLAAEIAANISKAPIHKQIEDQCP